MSDNKEENNNKSNDKTNDRILNKPTRNNKSNDKTRNVMKVKTCIKALLKKYNESTNDENVMLVKQMLSNWSILCELKDEAKYYDTHKNYHYIESEIDDSDCGTYNDDMDYIRQTKIKSLINRLFFGRENKDRRIIGDKYLVRHIDNMQMCDSVTID